MLDRYRAALALTSLLLLAASGRHHHHPRAHALRPDLPPVPAGVDLYSRRALRRARIILQLKLLQMHEEQLDRVRQALQRRMPIDQILNGSSPSPRP